MKYIKIFFNFLIRQLAKFHNWYAGLEEGKRFLYFLLFAMGPFVTANFFKLITDHKGFDVIAWVWIVFLIAGRMWWLQGNLKKYLEG